MLSDFLLPQPCFLCGADSRGGPVCAPCHGQLPVAAAVCCRCCAIPMEQAGVCGACLVRSPAFDASTAIFEYRFPVSDMIHRLKYHGDLYLAGQLGQMIAAVPVLDAVDVIVPLPLHRKRLRQRGFNQALELARALAGSSGLPLLCEAVLRERDTASQAGLDPASRKRNLHGAFRSARDFSGLSVLVVDDVMTTGATLDEFARTLKAAGARRVENRVLARTPLGR